MNVLILHGIMGKAGENWAQWLNDKLASKSYSVIMPDLPNADRPNRQEWLKEISNIMQNLDGNTIIVAHSLGVTSALDYLEQASCPIKGMVSVSGFSDDYGLELNSYFLKEKSIDFDKVNANTEKAFVFFGDNDPYVPQDSLNKLADNLKTKPVILAEGGHLNASAGFTEFPELLEAVLSI